MAQRTLSNGLLAVLAVLGAALPLAPAAGADLDYGFNGGDAPEPVAETKVQFGTGWYIRGDIGATRSPSIAASNSASYNTAPVTNPVYANGSSYQQSVFGGPNPASPALLLSNSSQVGYAATLGAGYQYNKWFRFDATFDFLKPVSSAYQGTSLPCITGTAALPAGVSENILSATCTPSLNASLKSYAAMVNGYIDLGTWYRVTPYVGAGVGLSFGHAQTSVTYKQNNGVPYQITYTDALSGASFYQNWDQHGSSQYYNLAFALMGGIAIDVYDHTKLDIGYRYLHLGEVLGSNITQQEVRAGLRYMIDN